MLPRIPPYLLAVLQRKVAGYTNQAIADELNRPLVTVETYVKRLIQFFKDEGWWDDHFSPRKGLLVCGQRYLQTLPKATQPSDRAVAAPDSIMRSYREEQNTTRDYAESYSRHQSSRSRGSIKSPVSRIASFSSAPAACPTAWPARNAGNWPRPA